MAKQSSTTRMRKVSAFMLSLILAVTFIPTQALATSDSNDALSSATQQAANPEVAPAANDIRSGDFGNQLGTYTFDTSTGTLTLAPKAAGLSPVLNSRADLNKVPWGDSTHQIRSIIIKGTVRLGANPEKIFSNLEFLEKLDLSGLDISLVKDMSKFFANNTSLKTLNLSYLDTSKITNMSNLFEGCTNLETLNLSGKFNTSSVTDMSEMFIDCINLKNLNISTFDTRKVTTMQGMFENCTFLEQLDLSHFSTPNVITMQGMFNGCIMLNSINLLGKFNTAKVTNMQNMFHDCTSLGTINLSNFNTSSATSMSGMFAECVKLKELDLSKFNTSKVTDMGQLFWKDTALEKLNISGFDTTSVTYPMNDVFGECTNLRVVKVGPMFMFTGKDLAKEQAAILPPGIIEEGVVPVKWISAVDDKLLFPEEIVDTHIGANTYFKTPVDVKDLTIEMPTEKIVYDGTIKTPKPRVTLDGYRELKLGTDASDSNGDYWIKYYNYRAASSIIITDENINSISGKDFESHARLEVIATNNQSGGTRFTGQSKSIPFNIYGISLNSSSLKIFPVEDQKYTGKPLTPMPMVTYNGKLLEYQRDYKIEHFSNISPGTATIKVIGINNYADEATSTFKITGTIPPSSSGDNNTSTSKPITPTVERISIYRLYNPNSGEHLYTPLASERDALTKLGWKYEKVAWTAPKTSKTPVYRLYNPYSGDHHYTTDAAEATALSKLGWNNEKICWYSDDNKSVPVYRLFNPNVTIGTHHYTTDKNEYETLGRMGWKKENIGWYGMNP